MNVPHRHDTNVTFGITRKSLEGTLIYACRSCGAPGVFSNDQRVKEFWPGCYDAALPASVKRPVGENCPNCGASRIANKELGELSASMPRWIWNCILFAKRVVLMFKPKEKST